MISQTVRIEGRTLKDIEFGFAFARENPVYATTIDKSLLDGKNDWHCLEFYPVSDDERYPTVLARLADENLPDA